MYTFWLFRKSRLVNRKWTISKIRKLNKLRTIKLTNLKNDYYLINKSRINAE